MAYSKKAVEAVDREFDRRRREADEMLAEKKRELYRMEPRLEEIERRLIETAIGRSRGFILENAPKKQFAEIKKLVASLRAERGEILQQMGLPVDYLEPKFQCQRCRDSGFVEGRACKCYERELKRASFLGSNLGEALAGQTFSEFDLSFYSNKVGENGDSPRDIMGRNKKFCQKYAAEFAPSSPSILMSGKTGLGKTHLSSAVAQAVLEAGFSVVYDMSQSMFSAFESERFGRPVHGPFLPSEYLGCDLLIIDDLGSEFITPFVVSTLFSVINGRLLSGRKTVISTNMTPSELNETYGEKIMSRIIGEYTVLVFLGSDVRQRKRQQKAENDLSHAE